MLLLAGTLGGCMWLKQRWPWREADVPVTPATEQLAVSPSPEPYEPASRPVSPPPEAPKPKPKPVALPKPDRPADAPPAKATGKTVIVAAPGLLINDRFITIDEILRSVAEPLSAIPAGKNEGEFRKDAAEIIQKEIRHQVFEGMVLPEAERRMTEPQKQFIDKEMADRLRDMIAEFDGSRKRLEDYYIRRGTTLAKIMKLERDSFVVQVHLQAKFAPAISVNRPMLLRYYRKHKASKYTMTAKVEMQIISATFKAFAPGGATSKPEPGAARAAARLQIDKARKMLDAGGDFADVAAKLSKGPFAGKGGVWPPMEKGSFGETKVEDAAFALKEGGVSGIIETENGFFIVKAKKVYPGKTVSFEDAQEQITRILKNEQAGRLRGEYFNRLLARATISSSKQLVQLGADRAVKRYWRK